MSVTHHCYSPLFSLFSFPFLSFSPAPRCASPASLALPPPPAWLTSLTRRVRLTFLPRATSATLPPPRCPPPRAPPPPSSRASRGPSSSAAATSPAPPLGCKAQIETLVVDPAAGCRSNHRRVRHRRQDRLPRAPLPPSSPPPCAATPFFSSPMRRRPFLLLPPSSRCPARRPIDG